MRVFFLLLVLTGVLGEDVSWLDTNLEPNLEGDYTRQTRHLKNVDLSKFRGVRITVDQSIVTLGQKQEIQLFRYLFVRRCCSCHLLNPKGNANNAMTVLV